MQGETRTTKGGSYTDIYREMFQNPYEESLVDVGPQQHQILNIALSSLES